MAENKMVPQLRFKGFSDEWTQHKLGDTASSFEYGLNATAKEYDGANKYLRITDIDDSSRIFKNDDLTSPDADLSVSDGYRLREGDILFARTGASVGKSFIYRETDGLVYFAGFLIRARIKREYDAEFIFQNTLTSLYEKYIQITSQRSGQPGVNAQEYADYSFLMPSDVEQQRIGGFLKQIDNLITLHQQKYDKFLALKKSMLEKMFPKAGKNVPEMRFAGFTEPWKQRKFGDVGSVAMCRRIFKHQTSDSGEIPFFKIGTFGGTPDAFISRELFEEYKAKYPYPENGDILLSASGSIGRTVEFKGENEYFQDSNIVWLKHDESITNPFLRHLYDVVKWAGIEGSTIKRLYNDNILKTEVLIPSVLEQAKIAEVLDGINCLITLHQRKHEKLRQLKQSLLQKMFV